MSKVLDLDVLERVAKAATPGPWVARYHDRICTADDTDGTRSLFHLYGGNGYLRQDQAFLANFDPPTALALIARVREAEMIRTGLAYDLDMSLQERDLLKAENERLRAALEGLLSGAALDWYVQQFARQPDPGSSGIAAQIHNTETRDRVVAAFKHARAALARAFEVRSSQHSDGGTDR